MAKKPTKSPSAYESTTCLFLSRMGQRYVLTQNESHYVLVTIPHRKLHLLSSILLSKNAGSPEAWKKAGFPARGFPKHRLRRVILKGQENICEAELQIGQESTLFQLSQPYEEQTFHSFFPPHIVIRQYVTQENIDTTRNLQRRVTIILYAFSALACLGLWLYPIPYWLWAGFCITVQLTGLILPMWKPMLFHLTDYPKGTPWLPGNLIWGPVICGWTLLYRMVTHLVVDGADMVLPLILTSIIAIPLSLLLLRTKGCTASPFRRVLQLLGIWCIMILCGIGTVAHVLHLFA